ncbi:MAG: WhiB family transcriptional regulator, partial [Actinobacteria bacterium]|nr:WhiB family transcriptional regulator [Actinomycetota bacterium]
MAPHAGNGAIQGVVQPESEARIAWVSQARCRQADPDELFVRGAAQRKAAVICRHCPVIVECGADALDNRVAGDGMAVVLDAVI